mmetsp:Transcript_16018/g.33456  ORF Transcript_16018/g.33456 Transcript_16018/m.33456 type:complete len:608 (+) Transcript_16018:98-1921(+)
MPWLHSFQSVVELGFFPTMDRLTAASPETIFQRTLICWSMIAVSAAVALLMVGIRSWLRGPVAADYDDSEFYTKDVMFVAYHVTVVYAVLGIGVFAGLTGRVHLQSGMPFDFYLLAVFEALSCTVVNAFWANVQCIHVIEALLPLGERFDLLRDATTVAAFLCADTVVSCCGAFLIVASTVLANLIVYSRRDDLRQLRREFWKQALPLNFQTPKAPAAGAEAYAYSLLATCSSYTLAETSDNDGPAAENSCCQWLESQLRHYSDKALSECLCIAGNATSNARQVSMIYEQIPQAFISTAVLLTMEEFSPIILLCALLAWFQIILMYSLRPCILCLQARNGMQWSNVSGNDMFQARRSLFWRSEPGRAALKHILLHKGLDHKERKVAAQELGQEIRVEVGKLPSKSTSRPVFHSNTLYKEQAAIFKRLLEQDEEELLRTFSEEADVFIDDDDHHNMEKGIVQSKKWSMVAILLNHVGGANVNYCGLTEKIFVEELFPKLKKELGLTYLNLNDNRGLCETQDGVSKLTTFMKQCPRLKTLKLKRSIANEDSKKKLLQEWAKHRRVDIAGLELEDTKPTQRTKKSEDTGKSFGDKAKSWSSMPSESQGDA